MTTKQEKIAAFDPSGVGLKNGNFIGLPFTEEEAAVVLYPVPWDVTVSYKAGTSTAPENILIASSQLDLFDADVRDAWKIGHFMRNPDPETLRLNNELREKSAHYIDQLESGNSPDDDHALQEDLHEINLRCFELKEKVRQETRNLLQAGKMVGLIGGDHSTPLGFYEALAEMFGSFGILHIDAHQDLRCSYEGFTYSHASIFYNAMNIPGISKLVQVGIRDYCDEESAFTLLSEGRIEVIYDHDIRRSQFQGRSFAEIVRGIIAQLPARVHVSLDIDGLDPKLCPNTGTPVPGGLEYQELVFLLSELARSGKKIIGFDLVEVGPLGCDWDGNVGARLAYKLSNLMAYSQLHQPEG